MITSKVSSKAQTTIPRPVRVALGLAEGDTLVYDLADGRVVLRRLEAVVVDEPFAHFDEWDSDADRAAYADL